jgi:hypothetical protein
VPLEGPVSSSLDGKAALFTVRPGDGSVAARVLWSAGTDLECRITLTETGTSREEADLDLRLPVARQTLWLLTPSTEDRPTADFSRPLEFGWRDRADDEHGLILPLVAAYRADEDWGLAAMADFGPPTLGFQFRVDPADPALVFHRIHLRLEPGKPLSVSFILFGHEGDWRPALAHVLERYPSYFVVADPDVPELHGAFWCSDGTPGDVEIASWQAQHVRTVEVHGTLPFYGRHLPLGVSWPVFVDDQWHKLKNLPDPAKPASGSGWQTIYSYVAGNSPGRMSVPGINDYIHRLHAHGMRAVMYFNPTEAWSSWISEVHPDALFRDAGGRPLHEWLESYLACPAPATRWGQEMLAEFSAMMDLYPDADGFFMDESTYDNLDFAHDDGWSIFDGRPGYRMGWAIDQLSEKCRRIAKSRGKFLWWNGPYQGDVAFYAEGMMAEAGDEAQVRSIQYLTLGGRACCTLSRKGEPMFQNCAAYGLYPPAVVEPAMVRLSARYWPIFDLFKAKTWVLGAHALNLPPGTKGNIFRLPDGNVLVTVVSGGRTVDGEPSDMDLPVEVRLPDAAEFKAAYSLSPDLLGKRHLEADIRADGIKVVIPHHRSVTAVLLARTGVHAALQGPWSVIPGGVAGTTLVVDNWNKDPVYVALRLPGRSPQTLPIEAGGSYAESFTVDAPRSAPSPRIQREIPVTIDGRDLGGVFEFDVDTDATP